jgi:hypothetical protein
MFNKIYHNTFQSLYSIKGAMLVGLLCIGIFSCKKNLSDADALQAKLASGMVSYVQAGNLVSLNGTNYNFTPKYVGVPIILTDAAKGVDTITSVVDPSLVSQYNQIYKENNPSFPQGAFGVSNQGSFPMISGSTQAKDSLYVLLKDGSQLKDSTNYLVPVTLSAKNGSKLKYSVFFFKVFVTLSSLKAKIYGGSTFNSTTWNRLAIGKALNATYINAYPDSLKWRTTLTTVFPANDTYVQATILTDDELKAVIVQQSNFNGALLLPAANRALTKDVSTIPARSLLSKDSITMKFYNKADLKKTTYYLTGVKLITYTTSIWGVPPVANDSTRAYLRVFLIN